ncbi:MAG: 16S rRNA (guanine(966)-N(2))-methyltransferase RsmD [Actinomycetes bacterium]
MRIIAGMSKGKTLFSPTHNTRPTSDRAREGLFSSLESEFGSMNELHILDLFAGTGAVGVEALSRGATQVHAVEKDENAAAVCMKNFNLVPHESTQVHCFKMSAIVFVQENRGVEYDIIFMDPPYEIANETIEKMLSDIHLYKLLQPRGIIAIERATKSNPFTWPAPFALEKIRSYGQGSIFYGGYSASVLP